MLINSFFNKIPDIPDIPNLSKYTFDNIIDLPENIHIHDFRTKNNFQKNKYFFSIGKYNEKRYNMYKGKLFEKGTNRLGNLINKSKVFGELMLIPEILSSAYTVINSNLKLKLKEKTK